MKRLLALAAFLIAAVLATPAVAQEDWTGQWSGTLATPALGQLRLVVTVSQSAEGALTAELQSPDQGPGSLPIPQFAIVGGRMTFAIPAIGASYEGIWQPAEGRFTGTFTQGVALPLDLTRGGAAARPVVAGLDGRWEGGVTRNGTVLRLILRVTTTAEGGTFAQLDSPDLLAMGLLVTELARDGQAVSFAVPAGNSRYRGILAADGNRMTGTWTRPDSPDAEVSFVRSDRDPAARARPQVPRPPLPYRTEEVRFENPRAPGVTLAGTLTLPEGSGPFVAAILISGSGAQDRDESVFGHKPFLVLADHLTRNGIAVLRYDDRGTAASTGTYRGATAADFATDANAAFAYLRARPEIDGRSIGFVGHSEGGMIGPLAMQDNGEIAYLVMMAGPGTPIPALMEAQRRAIGRLQGMSEADLDRTAAIPQAMLAAAASGQSDAEVEVSLRALMTDERLQAAGVPLARRDAMIGSVRDPWFRFFARYDPAPVLARIRVPVLAVNGSLDRQVVAPENLAGITAALRGNRDVTVTELPGLNHLFQTARTGGVGEYQDIEETMAPAAMALIAGWIRARFAPAR